ncbi:DEAD/DEAH box helicase [Flavobacterium sp.]|uniref:DEAD/DEAH box helicase n=1 Tax=Flavobacterium sp. TaxID=239 RepID=UPI002619C533|nr:DEAD/DEAH box helicase [Flavobacterium sp.]
MTFNDLQLLRNIQQALAEEGYEVPTPIQQQAIPIIKEGIDLVGCAQTGTGKTAAFAIPIIHQIHPIVGSAKKRKNIRALVITPTRELAIQIQESFETYGRYTNIVSTVIYGGVSQVPQVDQLKRGVDVLIATPGRLLDLHKQGHVNLDHLHHLVLDEADLMLDMGFINDVKKIIKLTPTNRQTLLFSATMPLPIRELAETFLTQPKYVTVTPVASTAEKIKQYVYKVEKEDKRKLLLQILNEYSGAQILIFTRTKHGADNVVKFLKKQNFTAEAIHGDKSQGARQRALDHFKSKEIQLLAATDIAARGIDIESLPFVINFDIPNIPDTYVHRIGRTGRAGNEGLAISLCGKDEWTYWLAIEKLIRLKIKVVENHEWVWNETKVNTLPITEKGVPQKKDFRNKKKGNGGKHFFGNRSKKK